MPQERADRQAPDSCPRGQPHSPALCYYIKTNLGMRGPGPRNERSKTFRCCKPGLCGCHRTKEASHAPGTCPAPESGHPQGEGVHFHHDLGGWHH